MQQTMRETVLDLVMNSPIGAKILKDATVAELKERQDLVDQIKTLTAQERRVRTGQVTTRGARPSPRRASRQKG